MWNDDTVVKEALDVVKWWLSTDVQKKFAANGGQSGLKSVMALPEYNDYRPWNRAQAARSDRNKRHAGRAPVERGPPLRRSVA